MTLRSNHAQYIFYLVSSSEVINRYPCPAFPPPFPPRSRIDPAKHNPELLVNRLRYGLAVATSIMFYMVVKKPSSDIARRVRQNKSW